MNDPKLLVELGASDQTAAAFASLNKRLQGVEKNVKQTTGSIVNFGKIVGSVFAAREVFEYAGRIANIADSYTQLSARIKIVSNSTSEFRTAQQALFDISQRTRTGFAETADLYAQMARGTKDLNVPQATMLRLTEGINKAIIVSGTSTQAANAALVQLGQGFAAGALRGQEFMSVQEQAPVILETVRKGLGLTQRELKKMAEEGRLTSDVFIRGFNKGLSELDNQFNQMPVTIGQSLQRLNNQIVKSIGEINELTGTSSAIATWVTDFADRINNTLVPSIQIAGGFWSAFLEIGKQNPFKSAGEQVDEYAKKLADLNKKAPTSGGVSPSGLFLQPSSEEEAASIRKAMSLSLLRMQTPGANSKAATMRARAAILGEKKIKPVAESPEAELKRMKAEWEALTAAQKKSITGFTQQESEARGRAARMVKTAENLKKAFQEAYSGYLDPMQRTKRQEALPDELVRIREEIEKADKAIIEANRLKFEGYLDPEKRGKREQSLPAELEAIRESIEASKTPLKQYIDSINNTEDAMNNLALKGIQTLEDSLVNLVNGTLSAKDAFKSMANSIVNDLIRMQIQKSITGPIAGAIEGAGGLGGIFSSFFGGGKAIGGPVQAGKPYMVGERGAEMFVPNQSGSIIPNNQMGGGGGVTIVQNINVTTGVQQTVRAEIMTLMPQIASAAKSAVADAKLRGGSYAAALR